MATRLLLLIALLYVSARVMALQSCQVYENPKNAKLLLSSVKISENKNNKGKISVIGINQKKKEQILSFQGKMKGDRDLFAFASEDSDRAAVLLRDQKGTLTLNQDTYKIQCTERKL